MERRFWQKSKLKKSRKKGGGSFMTEEEIRLRNEERRAKLDAVSRRNMEKCAAFIAKMIRKYGPEVLAEIESEEKLASATDSE